MLAYLKRICLGLVFSLLIITTVYAADYPVTGVITASSLRVRSGPGTQYTTVDTLKKNSEVTVYGINNNWYKISFNGRYCYVSSDYVTLQQKEENTDSTTQEISYGKVTASALNLRKKASTSSSVLTIIKRDQIVKIISKTDDWYNISFESFTGYVSAKYISLIETPDESDANVETPNTNIEQSFPNGRLAETVPSSVNLRKEPNTESDSLGTIKSGSQIAVYSLKDGWYYVLCDDTYGYIKAEYVVLDERSEFYIATVDTSSSLNLRSGPDTSYAVIASLKNGEQFIIIETYGDWHRIEYKNITGYIKAEYVIVHHSYLPPEMECDFEKANIELSLRLKIVEFAKKFLGYKYVYGAESPEEGFDCSGLVQYVYKNFGISVLRTASSQMGQGKKIDKSELLPGDLVFFKDPDNPSKAAGHVGIYIGNDEFIHAPKPGDVVKITSLSNSYYVRYYAGSRTYI